MELGNKPVVILDGREYALSYELADFAEAERRLNEPLLGPGGIVQFWYSGLIADITQKLVFIGICRNNPTYTMATITPWVTWDNIDALDEAIGPCIKPINDRLDKLLARAKAFQDAATPGAAPEPEPAPLAGAIGGVASASTPESTSASVTPISGRSNTGSGSTSSKSSAKSTSAKSA